LLIAAVAVAVSAAVGTAHAAPVAATGSASFAAGGSGGKLVVPHGQPLQIAFVNDLTGAASAFAPSLSNAVRMAVGFHPTVRGFRIQVNTYDNVCGTPSASVVAANAVVANPQNAAVLGHICSLGFAEALPIYQAADLVTISGSATNPALATSGFSVFNRVAVDDAGFDPWYVKVGMLPDDLAWQYGYEVIFGNPPQPIADLYYDAASLLLSDLKRVSRVDRSGSLVIDRAALAAAVRSTRHFQGVTCTITIDPATGNRIDDPEALSRCAGGDDDSDLGGQR
jgi:ABC-type branched-subunit amino acid transport system substrate-binding protein